MRSKDVLDGVAVFVTAAGAGSFSAAGRRLGISPSAVSQAIRALEQRLGAPLFSRSTRSLSLTDVGKTYLLSAAPALAQLREAAEEAAGRAGRPTGPLRLTMPRAPFELVVAPMLAGFQDAYPGVEVEIAVEARLVDIVREGFDAGFRYGNCLGGDMVAVQVAPGSEVVLVASPEYLDIAGVPLVPRDLLDHRVIACRSQATGTIIPWHLRSGDEMIQVVPRRATIVHDLTSQIDLAGRGLGILSASMPMLSNHLDAGTLTRVLPAWSSTTEATYLYFPSSRHQTAALRAFAAYLVRSLPAAPRPGSKAVPRGSSEFL